PHQDQPRHRLRGPLREDARAVPRRRRQRRPELGRAAPGRDRRAAAAGRGRGTGPAGPRGDRAGGGAGARGRPDLRTRADRPQRLERDRDPADRGRRAVARGRGRPPPAGFRTMSEDTAVRAERDGSAEAAPVSLSIPARVARALVLAAVFTCAACGLVYELALVALGSYLMGNSVTQASIVLSVMVFAMGVGSLLAKPLRRWPVAAFAVVEAALAVVGGLSVLALYAAFAWLSLYNPVLIVVAFLVGALIGAELPLLMTLLQRIRRQEAGAAVADLFAADYVGALIGGLAFPFLLLPLFGHIRGALLVGAVNVVAGMAVVLWLFRRELGRGVQAALWSAMAAVLLVLGGTYALADRFEVSARQVLYRDPIVLSQRTPYQEIVITRQVSLSGRPDMRLFLNGDLQFSSVDEYRYHESLVHPIMSGPHGRVLVLGGGDGLALREVLRYDGVRSATLVELDPEVLRLARTYG